MKRRQPTEELVAEEGAVVDDAIEAGLIDVEDEGFSIRGLRTVTEGYSLMPLGVLFALNFVDEFDRIAFATLISEIRDAFGMSDDGVQTLSAVTGICFLLAALPIGVLADRFKRVNLAIIFGLVWGCAAVATGLVWTVPLLYLARFLSGLGRNSNEVVHPSLLADYYPRPAHPQVFGLHRLANATAPVTGVLAGFIGTTLGWEAAFFILAAPTGIALLFASRLDEPERGQSLDKASAAAIAGEKAQSFGEASRELFQVRTLRRLWLGAFFFGCGVFQLANLISLYFENVFDFGPTGRGWVQFLLGLGTIVGLVVSSRIAAREVKAGRISRLPIITGLAFGPFAIGMVILTTSNLAIVSLIGVFFIAVGNGGWQPAYFSIAGAVAPPRLRSQAFAWAVLVFGSGGLAYVALLQLFPDDDAGYRSLTITLAGITFLAGMIGVSAAKFIEADAANALMKLRLAANIDAAAERRRDRRTRPLVAKGRERANGTPDGSTPPDDGAEPDE